MMKYYLMAPGPSMIPDRVLLEMAKPIIHHRTKEFEKVFSKVRKQLKGIFQTENQIVLHSSVGSGAMESAVVNCFSPGDKIVVVRSGKFGERWSEQAKAFKLKVIDLDVPWGKAVQVENLKNILEKEKDIKGVLTQACETSTGTEHPIEQMGGIVKKYSKALLLVDAITALGISPILTDKWNLDIVVTGSQKAFMLPPGLSMLSVSPKALAFMEEATLPRYYFDIQTEIKAQEKNQTHFTPAVSLIQGLSVALDMMEEEGLENIFARHRRLALATRAGVQAMGLKISSENPAHGVTAVFSPPAIDSEKIVEHMFKKYRFTIVGGQDSVKGKIFRIGHMGYCGDFDVLGVLSALEMTLKDLGHSFEWGAGTRAASEILHGSIK